MPCRYVIDKERRVVFTTASGRVTFAEAKAHDDQLRKDPDFCPEFNQLIDTTGMTELIMNIEEARRLASNGVFLSCSSRRAFLVTQPSIFVMGQLLEAYSQMAGRQDEVQVLYDRDAALDWLGIEVLPTPINTEADKKHANTSAAKNAKIA